MSKCTRAHRWRHRIGRLEAVSPIASGKSTIAYELGSRFRAADRSVAVLDLEDVVDTIGGFAGLTPARFRQAQLVYGELIAAWLRRRFDVIAHGPFFDHEEDEALLHAVPTEVTPRRVQLLATYEVALERTALDSARTLSKEPKLLRLTYDRVESLLGDRLGPPSEGLHVAGGGGRSSPQRGSRP